MSPTLNETITGFVTGDNLEVRRVITDLPAAIATAWFTVKQSERQDDDDALIKKEITTSDDPGVGQVEDAGGAGSSGDLRFDFVPDDTESMGDLRWTYDIQLKLSTGEIYTPEKGTITMDMDVTKSTT